MEEVLGITALYEDRDDEGFDFCLIPLQTTVLWCIGHTNTVAVLEEIQFFMERSCVFVVGNYKDGIAAGRDTPQMWKAWAIPGV